MSAHVQQQFGRINFHLSIVMFTKLARILFFLEHCFGSTGTSDEEVGIGSGVCNVWHSFAFVTKMYISFVTLQCD